MASSPFELIGKAFFASLIIGFIYAIFSLSWLSFIGVIISSIVLAFLLFTH
ncbi:hypothetical protein HY500_03815 [Candidatus Woesearchaeota archaeon]|nr:hypothetical protein [Candidatus Woesearchaeota archaeon]